MKKLLILTAAIFLSACSTLDNNTQVVFEPKATLSDYKIDKEISFTLTSQDSRTAQYVALIETNSNEPVQQIHATKNVRTVYEGAIYQQFYSQGFYATRNSNNIINIDIIDTLARVKQGTVDNEINAKISVQITAETPNGKFVKSFYTSANKTAALKATASDIEDILNSLASNVLQSIATDAELKNYIMENF